MIFYIGGLVVRKDRTRFVSNTVRHQGGIKLIRFKSVQCAVSHISNMRLEKKGWPVQVMTPEQIETCAARWF